VLDVGEMVMMTGKVHFEWRGVIREHVENITALSKIGQGYEEILTKKSKTACTRNGNRPPKAT